MLTGAAVPTLNGIAPNLLVAFRTTARPGCRSRCRSTSATCKRLPRDLQQRHASAPARRRCSTPTPTPGPAPTATRRSTPTTRSSSWRRTPAAIAPSILGARERRRRHRRPGDGDRPAAPGPDRLRLPLPRRRERSIPGAGGDYVVYNFTLDSAADYKTTYNFADGPNPENSLAFSANYSYHFGDRWQDDELIITAGAATAVDILDRHKPMFAPGYCGRTEDTFNDAEGAFVINKSGPVRAIRSYIGANSGPLHAARARLLRRAPGHPHVPARPRDPQRHGLLRLRRRRRPA